MTNARMEELIATHWPDGRPKIAPVQGWAQGIPWSLHLKAYSVYCQKWGAQEALIDLAGRGCRGGFSTGELDDFIPGWREEVSEIGRLRAALLALANAADEVGVKFFDTDTMEPEVEAMQKATLAARAALT